MCGIFAYSGIRHDAPSLVLSGLKTLEYRGYDSFGVAISDEAQNTIQVEKYTGKIADAKIPKSSILHQSSSFVVGHTRWATHGGVTVKNAHPHTDCIKRIAIVHNGIVENYEVLKDSLIKSGHIFLSDTDTEVIAHLIEENLKKYPLERAVRVSFNALTGLSGLVVLDSKTKTLLALKNGSPLIVGLGKKEFYVASDLSGITPHTSNVVFLKDNEMVVIRDSLSLLQLPKGNKITPKIEKISWVTKEETLGRHKHFMVKEIFDQPQVIENILQNLVPQVESLSQKTQRFHRIFFIGAGTAFNASLAGVTLFSKIAHIQATATVASEFTYVLPFADKKTLILALSQSGETIDIIEPLTVAQKKGAYIVGILNVLGSTIYRMADTRILLGAGQEKAVASTKAYIAKVTVLLLLSHALSGQTKKIIPQINLAAREIKRILTPEYSKKIKLLARKLKNSSQIYVIGRGLSYSSALEAALKIKEVSYIPTEGLAGGELKHGTIALIQKGTPCIVFAPLDETRDAILSNAIEIRSRGGYIIGVSPKNSQAFDYFIEVKDVGDATILAQIVPLQLLAYYLSLARGIKDPDKPRNLAKSVTVK